MDAYCLGLEISRLLPLRGLVQVEVSASYSTASVVAGSGLVGVVDSGREGENMWRSKNLEINGEGDRRWVNKTQISES